MKNTLKFINTSNVDEVAEFVAGRIIEELEKGQRVLWFVPGGSSIKVAAAASKIIAKHDHSSLTVTLTDERYGDFGHPDSNWRQLKEAGFLLPDANTIRVLVDYTFQETAKVYASNLKKELPEADFVIGLFGVGADGHTAGMLPDSPAIISDKFACAYDAGAFERVTITPIAIPYFNEVIIFAQGENKWPVLKKLNEDVPVSEQPVQILKTVKKVTIFSDYKS